MPTKKKNQNKGTFKKAIEFLFGIPRRLRNQTYFSINEYLRVLKKHLFSTTHLRDELKDFSKNRRLEISNTVFKIILITLLIPSLFFLSGFNFIAGLAIKLIQAILFPILIISIPFGIPNAILSTIGLTIGSIDTSILFQVLPIFELSIQNNGDSKSYLKTIGGTFVISVSTQILINILPINIITQSIAITCCLLLTSSTLKTLKQQFWWIKNMFNTEIHQPGINQQHKFFNRSTEDLFATPILYFGILFINSTLITQCLTFILPTYSAPKIILNTLLNWAPTIKTLMTCSLISKFFDNINPDLDSITVDLKTPTNSSISLLKPIILKHAVPLVQALRRTWEKPVETVINHLSN